MRKRVHSELMRGLLAEARRLWAEGDALLATGADPDARFAQREVVTTPLKNGGESGG